MHRYNVALGVEGARGVPTRAGITCSTIAFRELGLLIRGAEGREVFCLNRREDLLLSRFDLADVYIRGLLVDYRRKGAMAARPGGELAIFNWLLTRGPYPGHMGPPGAVLETLLVRRPNGLARVHPDIFSMLGPRPWDDEVVVPLAAPYWRSLRFCARGFDPYGLAAAAVDVRREWLERADGASQTLAFCRRSRHHTGLLLRTDANLDGDASQSLQDIAQELVPFLVDEDDSQFEPDPEAA